MNLDERFVGVVLVRRRVHRRLDVIGDRIEVDGLRRIGIHPVVDRLILCPIASVHRVTHMERADVNRIVAVDQRSLGRNRDSDGVNVIR